MQVAVHVRRLDPGAAKPGRRAPVVEVHAHRKVGKQGLGPLQGLPPAALCEAQKRRVDETAIELRRQQPRRAAPEVRRGEIDEAPDCGRPGTGHQMVDLAASGRLSVELEDCVGDVVDGDHVDRRRAARGQRGVGAGLKCPQRRVEHVEAGGPAALALPDDDARPEDPHRKLVRGARDEALGLELRALVWVAKALSDVERRLAEGAAMIAGYIGGRDVGEAAQPALGLTLRGEVQQAPGAPDVDLPRRRQGQRERDRRGEVDDLIDPPGQIAPGSRCEPEMLTFDVAGHRRPAFAVRLAVAADLLDHSAQSRVRLRGVARTHERVDVAVAPLQVARQHLHAEEPGRAGEEHAPAHRELTSTSSPVARSSAAPISLTSPSPSASA